MKTIKEISGLLFEIQTNCSLKIPSVHGAYIPLKSGYDSEIKDLSLCINIEIDNHNTNYIQSRISNLKNQMINPDDFAANFANNPVDKKIAKIYKMSIDFVRPLEL